MINRLLVALTLLGFFGVQSLNAQQNTIFRAKAEGHYGWNLCDGGNLVGGEVGMELPLLGNHNWEYAYNFPSVGFAIGVERVMIACDALGVPNPERPLDVFGVALGAAAKNAMVGLLAQARAAGLSADMDFGERSLKAQMRAANHKGATVALILGDSELSEGKVTVKDLREGGGQAPAPLGSFLDAVRPLLAGEPGK